MRDGYVRVPKTCVGPSKTRPEFADECDVNTIMGRWRRQGFTDPPTGPAPQYGDFSQVDDYMTALNRVNEAQEQFMALPSRVRARVENDPGKFLEFVQAEANVEELKELGLVEEQLPLPLQQGGETSPPVEPETPPQAPPEAPSE